MSDQLPQEFIHEDEGVAEEQGKKRFFNGKKPNKKLVGFLAVALCLGLMVGVSLGLSPNGSKHVNSDEAFSSGSKNVQIIDITGTIKEEGESYNQSFINERINKAANDSDNVAIALIMNTPGGSVYQCDETYLNLMDYKEETGRPIYVYSESMNASAGYYISCAADKIYANRNSTVGYIGVIGGQFIDASQFLSDLGINVTTIHSGKNKNMGSMSVAPTEEQLAIMQTVSDEAYNQFVDVVAEGRGLDRDTVLTLADGRPYTAKQALANGLIDGVMTMDEFDEMLHEELGDNIVFYHETYTQDRMTRFLNSLGALSKTIANRGEVASSLAKLEDMTITEPMYIAAGYENE